VAETAGPRRLGDSDAALLERTVDGLRDYNRIMCDCSPDGRPLELEGVMAAVVPATPERSLMNAVVYERSSALAAALEELDAAYEKAGVEAWMVWVPAVDAQARKLVKRRGHRLEAHPTAMARELDGIERPPEGALPDWTAEGEHGVMAAICDRVFAFGDAFRRTFSSPLPERAHVYLASIEGEPASCLLTSEHDGNCAVDLVATVPEARHRGLAAGLVLHALADAAERGCSTTTLSATPEGRPLYERLGYRALCPLQQWERRRSATG
jgi:GNAT superfamily N-acetyltransferase